MAWNEPGSNGGTGGSSNNSHKSSSPPPKKPDTPPDLDEVLRELHKKFNQFLGRKKVVTLSSKSPDTLPGHIIINIGIFIIIALWVLSGFFIVSPPEKAAVLLFGKYIGTDNPGLHWIPSLFESKYVVNVQQVLTYPYQAEMLTQDENIVSVDLVVKYRIDNLQDYLFNVSDPNESLQQATASALRQVIGQTNLDSVLTSGREVVREETTQVLEKTLDRYHSGLLVTGVSLQSAKPPEEVTAAFDDAIKAREDAKRFKNQALTYANRIVPNAQGNASRLIAEANGYKQQVILQATAATAYYLALLPEYVAAPAVMRERMYLDTMQSVLTHSTNVIVSSGQNNNLVYLPLDKLMSSKSDVSVPEKPVMTAPITAPASDAYQAPLMNNYPARPSREENSHGLS